MLGSPSNPNCVRILHLEDSQEDAELIRSTIESAGLPCQVTLARNRSSFNEALDSQTFDLVLCDHAIPGYDGFAALRQARYRQPTTPVIMLSGMLDDAQAVESLKSGATDYILKQNLTRLVPAIRRALNEAAERQKQYESEEEIRTQATLLNLTGDAIIVRGLDDRIVFWNSGATTIFGWESSEALGQPFGKLLQGNPEILARAMSRLTESGAWTAEVSLKNKSGGELAIFSRWNLLRDKAGHPQGILTANTDITEKKKLEMIALRAQRMDSIGSLAGGIAHDLNNALAPVLMSAELLRTCRDDESRERFLDIIASSAQRATGMVKQVLGFARGKGSGGAVPVGDIILEMSKIVRDTFPKSIEINAPPTPPDIWQIVGDAIELHQVLLNLCVNARDAMPKGGRLTLSAQNVTLNHQTAPALRVAGPYVILSVADTGSGIPPAVLTHIFEPFFTTKLPDQGTGLGLSTVAGIVKQSGGAIDIKTEIGRGTEFKIYLPAIEIAPRKLEHVKDSPLPEGHGELILIIEDEEAVRELTRTALENYGYRVLVAQNGVQGINEFKRHQTEVKLLVTDTDMPHLDGMGAIRAIKELRPDIPVIIASGSKQDTERRRQIDEKHLINLGKPFSVDQLLVAVSLAIRR